MSIETIDTLVVGGGQAGLAMSEHLSANGVPHLVLERVIERCLAKDPAKRYGTTHELRRAIESYVADKVTVDPRKRMVVFLKNRRILSEGEATGSATQQVKGLAKQVEGKVQKGVGDAQEAVRDADRKTR